MTPSAVSSSNDEKGSSESTCYSNGFVGYLNSLHRSGAGNENALAEFQSCNENFHRIHVLHPLVNIILKELTNSDRNHVVLTGHAGDGKSTIALDVFKMLKGIPVEDHLENPPKLREDIDQVSIIKDLSERNKSQDPDLINEIIFSERRFLLVSNTGTLMDLVKNNSELLAKDRVTLESDVLESINSFDGKGQLKFHDRQITVFNLAKLDNLDLAIDIFKRMLLQENWGICSNLSCKNYCPIKFNVDLINQNQDLVLDRIFLTYRRMYEYGTRFTIRQFTEHLSYLITSGIEEPDVHRYRGLGPEVKYRSLFFNRFFGDDGIYSDPEANQIRNLREIKKQEFGHNSDRSWEHLLWLNQDKDELKVGNAEINSHFQVLRQIGSGAIRSSSLSPSHARLQVRRMLFFLYRFNNTDLSFITKFLNSPSILMWQGWQKKGFTFTLNEKKNLEQKIFHVIQEHFSGIRLPEGSNNQDQRLYVTLGRRRNEIRQSAQIALAQVDWGDSTELLLKERNTVSGGIRYDLVLVGRNQIKGVDLCLQVPFLDYVISRHFGELGEVLQVSYIERLDSYKSQFQSKAHDNDENRIVLVRLKTDNTFKRLYYSIVHNKLEVTNG